ncbi:MAG: hypothetical protein LC749_21680, partial [Actinobacteria bacterium]|nr:hypothetical protein [Actinomycetota bacterium]
MRMVESSAPVFPQPTVARDQAVGLIEPHVHLFTEITSPAGQYARDRINNWYVKASVRSNSNFINR